ncbi:MAG: DMT family transporter [Saprospiraceae bacterium]|jgi:drug/metabolite transporter (DMT)-like permease|nr:DMT family transporter [Saprospiraceae bacterium]MBL0025791.1 DMT family transporter [Saprospiraceae bacterium]
MSGQHRLQNILELNLALLTISTSGALGRYIDMPVVLIIAFRSLIGGFIILLFCKWNKYDMTIKPRHRMIILAGGLLLGLHWITYFYALKLSNVAVGMMSLYTYPIITAFLEPIFLKTKFQKIHILLGGLVLVGIYFLNSDVGTQKNYSLAIAFGVFSALCYSLYNINIKSKVSQYNGSVLMLSQLFVIAIFLSPSFIYLDSSLILKQLPANLTLALLTTAIGHTFLLHSFKYFSTTSISIMSGIQPLYGIIIGIIFLGEYPEANAMLGGGLILTSVLAESLRS